MPLSSEYPGEVVTHERKRRAHTKSRKGCDNCKLRHEKCDEGKPSCQKCLVFGVSCIYGHQNNVGLCLPWLQLTLENCINEKQFASLAFIHFSCISL
ncbi:hypothetical protein NKR23_g6550 [Pleurostoma richardsiae]|uniref:Zn(2)-C6 fungal-type domain-containing protein n=1 Tax=Pleurostoma richardsiae TaxID=41990 RepID=A0AA38RNZ6_9PEZI|nr:hypothetical protein NKR23_g6550 [Pleurostoma richardsiae]